MIVLEVKPGSNLLDRKIFGKCQTFLLIFDPPYVMPIHFVSINDKYIFPIIGTISIESLIGSTFCTLFYQQTVFIPKVFLYKLSG